MMRSLDVITERRRRSVDIPIQAQRVSLSECCTSYRITANGSSNTDRASSKDTPCFRSFWAALASSQSKSHSQRR